MVLKPYHELPLLIRLKYTLTKCSFYGLLLVLSFICIYSLFALLSFLGVISVAESILSSISISESSVILFLLGFIIAIIS